MTQQSIAGRSTGSISRRTFSKAAAGAVAAATVYQSSASYARVIGANDKVRVGFLGTANRGRQVLDGFVKQPDMEVAALCDVDQTVLNQAKEKYGTAATFITGGNYAVNDDHTAQHARNFIDCIKSRELPNTDVEEGHISTSMSLIANISLAVGQRLKWDPVAERFIGNEEFVRTANAMLHYEYRAPWKLEV